MVRLAARLPLLLLAVCARSAPSGGVTGTWAGHVTDPHGGSSVLTLSLRARGDTLTGTVAGPGGLEAAPAIERGRIAGDRVTFEIGLKRPDGSTSTFAFAVTVAGDRMQGTVSKVAEGMSVPFTATRTSSSVQAARAAPADDTQPPDLHGSNPTPQDAQAATLAAFTRYEVVGLGILSYANRDFDDFILALIRNPAFPDKVNDIVVECGNSLYQPVLDRYIAGEDVPLSEVRRAWRNTTQPFCGVTTFYEELFPLVRRINRGLAPGKQLRVLAGDPPVDWSRVKTLEDGRAFEDRDANIASVMEKEVLAKHRKALMIFGARHLMHGGGGAVGRYEAGGYPNVTFVVIAHNGFGNGTPLARYNGELERRMAAWPVPSLVPFRGAWLDDLAYRYFFPDERGGRISARVDGYLYLGPGDQLLNDPIPARAVLDTAYMAELQRRADIRGGALGAAAILREAADSSVFFNGPPEPPAAGERRGRVTRHE